MANAGDSECCCASLLLASPHVWLFSFAPALLEAERAHCALCCLPPSLLPLCCLCLHRSACCRVCRFETASVCCLLPRASLETHWVGHSGLRTDVDSASMNLGTSAAPPTSLLGWQPTALAHLMLMLHALGSEAHRPPPLRRRRAAATPPPPPLGHKPAAQMLEAPQPSHIFRCCRRTVSLPSAAAPPPHHRTRARPAARSAAP